MDPAQSLRWYQKSAALGYAEAQNELIRLAKPAVVRPSRIRSGAQYRQQTNQYRQSPSTFITLSHMINWAQ
jgi:TPR repeat protein